MDATFDEVKDFVEELYQLADESSETIQFSANSEIQESLKYERRTRVKATLSNHPKYQHLKVGGGVDVWSVVLYADLRNSSNRAVEIGARDTYLSMHCLIGGLAYLIQKAGGLVANFRGDGLFGLFGLDEDGKNPTDLDESECARDANSCGIAMVEMIDKILNPILIENKIRGDLRIGVGIDAGKVIITKIGLPNTNEVTAYGPPVNHAAKFCGGNQSVCVSERVKNIFPTSSGGLISFERTSVELRGGKKLPGYKAKYPKNYSPFKKPSKVTKRVCAD
jgi:adenylate cyclase